MPRWFLHPLLPAAPLSRCSNTNTSGRKPWRYCAHGSDNKNCVPILECVQGKEVGKRLGSPRHHSHTSAQSVYESLGQTEKCTEQSHSQVTSLMLPEHLSIVPFKPRNLCSDSDKWNYSWGRKMVRMLWRPQFLMVLWHWDILLA